jgi:hypothetical protein
VLVLEPRNIAAEVRAGQLQHPLAVRGMIVLHPRLDLVRDLMVLVSEYALQFRVDEQIAGSRIPVPDTDRSGRGRYAIALARRVQHLHVLPYVAMKRSEVEDGDRDQQKNGLQHQDPVLAADRGGPVRDATHGDDDEPQHRPTRAAVAEAHGGPQQQRQKTQQRQRVGQDQTVADHDDAEEDEAEREQGCLHQPQRRRSPPGPQRFGRRQNRRHEDHDGSGIR